MSGIKDQAEIEEMRRRLYERDGNIQPSTRHELSPTDIEVPEEWSSPFVDKQSSDVIISRLKKITDNIPPSSKKNDETESIEKVVKDEASKRYSYRSIILLASLASFIFAVLFSAVYMFLGTNQISNYNIAVALTGPLSIGGGEVLPLQATVTNQNRVPIESAVLIVRFPSGTKSADGSGRDILEERIQLDRINAGETINVPVRAIIFGEESQEKTISAEVEYRLIDSNGTFYKRADPLVLAIHSAPLVLRVTSLERVSSGQEIDIKLELQSNATAPLNNILLTAEYPVNFDFTSAEPSPSFRKNTWLLKDIAPDQVIPIIIKGLVIGNQDEEFRIQFVAGTPRQDNQFTIGTQLTSAAADFVIERPFISLSSTINGLSGSVVTTSAGDNTSVSVVLQNTLSETLFDVALEVGVSGNVLSRERVIVSNGFYDSVKDVVRFDVSGDSNLAEVPPGGIRRFVFSITPNNEQRTPIFEISANAYARRVSENRVIEQIIGTVKTEVRYTTSVQTVTDIRHVSGPVPPIADQMTSYDVTFTVTAGGNDITGAVVGSSLPQYVDWVSGPANIVFNPVSKELTWNIGDVKAGEKVSTTFRVAITPSQAQIGQTPALVGAARLRATDRFTGVVVRSEDAPKSTQLPNDAGYGQHSGRVGRAVVESPN
jgi:hypothetical protein